VRDILELLLYIIIHPQYALKTKDKPLLLSLVVLVMAALSSSMGSLLVGGTSVEGNIFFFGITLNIIFLLLFWLIAVSLWHLVAEGFRGRGKVLELFPSIGICLFPAIFLGPLALLMTPFGSTVTKFYPLLKSIVVIWIIVLQILALRMTYEFSGTLATLSYLTPFFALLAVLALIGLFSVLFLISKTATEFLPLISSLPAP